MAEQKIVYVNPRIEEVFLLAIVGAGVSLAVASLFAAFLPGYLPTHVTGLGNVLRAFGLYSCVVAGATCGALFALHQERDTHLSGSHYYPVATRACRAIQAAQRERFSTGQQAGETHGVCIGGVEFSRTTEREHLYVVGLTGGGKTVLLESLIDQALSRGDRLVLHDIKGDLTARYYDPKTAVLLGPWDTRAAIWDAARDIDQPARADELAAAVCSVRRARGEDKMWSQLAATVLRGVIKSYMQDGAKWTWAQVGQALTGDAVELVHQAAKGDPRVRKSFASAFPAPDSECGPSIGKTGQSVLTTLAAASDWLSTYGAVDAADRDRIRFSLQDWMTGRAHREVRMVILNYHAHFSSICEALFGAMIDSLAATLTSPLMAEVDADAPATWCILDEFPQLGAEAISATQRIAEIGRSRGVRVVTALQDETQLAAKLGQDQAAPILAQQVTRVYLRCSDKTAAAVCHRAGQRQVHRIETTAENGAIQGKTKRTVEEPALRPGDLTSLRITRNGPEMILHTGSLLGRLIQPFPEHRPAQAKPYMPSATWQRGALLVPTPMPATPPQVEARPDTRQASTLPAFGAEGEKEEGD